MEWTVEGVAAVQAGKCCALHNFGNFRHLWDFFCVKHLRKDLVCAFYSWTTCGTWWYSCPQFLNCGKFSAYKRSGGQSYWRDWTSCCRLVRSSTMNSWQSVWKLQICCEGEESMKRNRLGENYREFGVLIVQYGHISNLIDWCFFPSTDARCC